MPRIIPAPRYFSMPSMDVGAEARRELLAMGLVVDPFARRCDPLAGGDHRGVADDGDQFAVAARLDAQDAQAVLGVVEGDALDKACQNLPGRRFQLGLWRGGCSVGASSLPHTR